MSEEETLYIEPDPMGKVVGVAPSGLLIHELEGKHWVSGYTLEGFGVENLSEEERKACGLT